MLLNNICAHLDIEYNVIMNNANISHLVVNVVIQYENLDFDIIRY